MGRGAGYGLDAELARKAAANYDINGEHAAREWIEVITGVHFDDSFSTGLKDGTLLCKLLNCIAPGTVKKINTSAMPFKQMENVSAFLKGCRALGVAEHSLFETVDLYEEKDMGLVIKCIFALGSTVQSTVPEFHGPHLGAKLNTANKRQFTPAQVSSRRLVPPPPPSLMRRRCAH
jgi:transgelin